MSLNTPLEVCEALEREVARRRARLENPPKGMTVPDHSDFCSAPPSVIARLEWWLRELRRTCGQSDRAAKIERVRAAWGKTPGKTYLTYEQMAAAAVDALEGM